ncbi:MAG: hypothetical protein CM15mP130_0640 [Verrucomicrobiota bacterium]|nr:MAG: hypothetical protein CM15mP130_0640 [Verrucomicrobiota bacterium]
MCGGHRFVKFAPEKRFVFDWKKPLPCPPITFLYPLKEDGIRDAEGLGIKGKGSHRGGSGEAFAIRFESDVLVESIGLKAGKEGTCGGSLRMGNRSALAIYCTDADNDAKDQQGIASDLGNSEKRRNAHS